MRKCKIDYIVDSAFWFLVLILPLMVSLITTLSLKEYKANEGDFTTIEKYERDKVITMSSGYVAELDFLSSGTPLTSGDKLFFQLDNNEPFTISLYYSVGLGGSGSYTWLKYENNVWYMGTSQLNFAPTSWTTYNQVFEYIPDLDFIDFPNNIYYYNYSMLFGTGETSSDKVALGFNYVPSSDSTIIDTSYTDYVLTESISSSDNPIIDKFLYNLDFVNNEVSFNDNIIYNGFCDILGTNGLLPLLNDNSFTIKYLSYCIIVFIFHVLFDVLAFIPRLAHKLNDKFYNVGGLKD